MEGPWFDTLTHNDGAQLDAVTLDLDGFTLQLVQYHAGGGGPIATGHNHVGNLHLCIYVDDVDAKHAEIARKAICSFPDSEIKRALLAIPEFVVERSS